MKTFLTCSIAVVLITVATAQVNSQTSASGSSQTSVSASQSGANANTSNSANVNQNTKAPKKTNADASGSASQGASANTGAAQIPSGTKVPAVLDKSVDSRKCKEGDEVVAKTTSDVVANGKVVIPKNSKLIGHVTEASAKANGQSESKLGIVFDKAMLRNGSTVPMQARIQALAAPVVSAAAAGSDDMSAPMGAAGANGAGSARAGGPLGGAVGGVGNTVGGVTNTAGDVTNAAGSTVNSTAGATTGAVGRTAGGTVAGTGGLTSNSSGVIGLKNLQLNSDNSATTTSSVITSTGKNVKLDSGSRLVLAVVGGAQTSQ